MSKNVKNVPALRFKGFSDAWEKRKLGEVLSERKNRSSDLPLLSVTINHGVIQAENNGRKDNSSSDLSNYKVVHKGDIPYNSMRMWQGASGYSYFEGIVSPAYTVLVPNDQSDGLFWSYCLKRGPMLSLFTRFSQGLTSDTWNLKYPQLSVIPVEVPKEFEQMLISNLLRSIDNLIAATQGKLDQLEMVKKALLQHLFDQSMRFKGYSDPWEKRKLGELGDTYTGLSGKSKLDFGHGEAQYVTYMNVFKNPIADSKGTDSTELDDRQNQVRKNDVFFTTSSETPEEVGMSSVWPVESENVYLNSFCFGYRFLDQDRLSFPFLAQQFRSPSFRKKMILLAQGISRYNISKKKVLKIPIFLPTLTEQKRLGSFLTNLDKLIAATQSRLSSLKSLKKALLQGLFI
ncbi:restriction endonuclease subunit S [Lacticaseibacillus chiayiensis]|uniref:restriction endonuclease subunit S n=1 Tax=Lacticaseibacillus chiayiensis TaxID=2100821 RepID=UPI001BD04924|nr:restriction endonuclease subunit S [Lacticaseibacillus chiayiensis]QVI33973.1 restriction endonuclease subunit S [Lacticaseibacillus chiayiensis]